MSKVIIFFSSKSSIQNKKRERLRTVAVADVDTDEEKEYQIVGDYEADIEKNLISVSSPIAKALIGKEVGDTVEFMAPGGKKSFEILVVKYI